jgi:ornithine cyclodeaminase/alanine dehydrogenase-like protein (mu-crystallin family)
VLFLSAAAVEAAMPDLDHQLGIAERALRGVGHGAQVPGKRTLHPAPESSFAYAMPAYDPGFGAEGETLGVKWVTGYPTNSQVGLTTINSLIVLNDPTSLHPLAILDGSRITASRTAAVSAICIRQLAPDFRGRTPVAAIVGAGVQGHAHLAPLGARAPRRSRRHV